MKPLSERDENFAAPVVIRFWHCYVGMKPLSERDENNIKKKAVLLGLPKSRNEATL